MNVRTTPRSSDIPVGENTGSTRIGAPDRPPRLRLLWPASMTILLCGLSHAQDKSGAVGVEKSSSSADSVKRDETKGVKPTADGVENRQQKATRPTVRSAEKESGDGASMEANAAKGTRPVVNDEPGAVTKPIESGAEAGGEESKKGKAPSLEANETDGVKGAVDPEKSGVEKAPRPTVQGTKEEGGTTGSQSKQAGGVRKIKGLEQVGVVGTVQGGVKPPQSGAGGSSRPQANLEVVLRLLGPRPAKETPPSSGGAAAAAAAISAGGSSTEERESGGDSRDEIRPSPAQQLKRGS